MHQTNLQITNKSLESRNENTNHQATVETWKITNNNQEQNAHFKIINRRAKVMCYGLRVVCHGVIKTCYLGATLVHVMVISELFGEDFAATWVQLGVILGHAGTILESS